MGLASLHSTLRRIANLFSSSPPPPPPPPPPPFSSSPPSAAFLPLSPPYPSLSSPSPLSLFRVQVLQVTTNQLVALSRSAARSIPHNRLLSEFPTNACASIATRIREYYCIASKTTSAEIYRVPIGMTYEKPQPVVLCETNYSELLRKWEVYTTRIETLQMWSRQNPTPECLPRHWTLDALRLNAGLCLILRYIVPQNVDGDTIYATKLQQEWRGKS